MAGVCITIDRSLHNHFLSLCPFPSFVETFTSILDLVCGGSWTASLCVSVRNLLDYFIGGFRGHVSDFQHSWLHKLGDFLVSVALLPSCAPRLVHCIKSFAWTVLSEYENPLLFSKGPFAGFRYSRPPVSSVSSLGSSVVVLKLLLYHSAPFGASWPSVVCWPTALAAFPVPLGVALDPLEVAPVSVLFALSFLLFIPFQCPLPFLPSVPGHDPPRSLVFFPPGVDPPWWWLSGVFCPVVSSYSGSLSSWCSVWPISSWWPCRFSLSRSSHFLTLWVSACSGECFSVVSFGGSVELSVGLVVGLLVWSMLAFLHLS